jgi:hypothetical protein
MKDDLGIQQVKTVKICGIYFGENSQRLNEGALIDKINSAVNNHEDKKI